MAWKLSVNRHQILILFIKFMDDLSHPLSIRCKSFVPGHSFPLLVLSHDMGFDGNQMVV